MSKARPMDVEKNFTKLTNDLSRQGHLKALGKSAFVIYFLICQNLNAKTQECNKSLENIRSLTGFDVKTISNALSELERKAYISIRRQKAEGFKTRHYYSILPLPENQKDRENKYKGGDIGVANAAKQKMPPKQLAQARESHQSTNQLYVCYLAIQNHSTLDLWSEPQFHRSKAIRAAIEQHGKPLLLRAFQYLSRLSEWSISNGIQFQHANEYILNPSKAVAAYEEYLLKQDIEKKERERARDVKLAHEEKARREKEERDSIEKLYPKAAQILVDNGELDEHLAKRFLDKDERLPIMIRIKTQVQIEEKAREIHQQSPQL